MVFNDNQEKTLAYQLVTKWRNLSEGFLKDGYFDSSIQNFLMHNQCAIECKDLSKFDPICIMNGIHCMSNPINMIFESGYDHTDLWKLLNYFLLVYNPFYELRRKDLMT